MGCTHSKVDDLPAVALCRERCGFLDEAIHQRYALAEAHLAYLSSLKSIGFSLQRFFDHQEDAAQPTSPVLNLPSHHRKADPQPSTSLPPPPAAVATTDHHHHSHSNSGSHLHFHSDSEDDDSAVSGSLHHHSGASSPLHNNNHHHLDYPSTYGGHMGYNGMDHESLGFGGGNGGFMQMNYMRNQTTPSLLYQQRPMTSENVYMGDSSNNGYYPYGNYQNDTSYSNYSNYPGGFSGTSSSPPRMPYGSVIPSSGGASTSKAPPPPPSPPKASTWDFLNPFESFETNYPPYTSSRNSREVREEEGIPDLEEEDYHQEVVKEVHIDQKHANGGQGSHGNHLKAEDEVAKGIHEETVYTTRPRVSIESDPVEYEVHMVDKKVVNDEKRSGDQANVKPRGGFKGDIEVINEIQIQFERASESGNDLSTILEVGKMPYNRKHSAYQVPSKMLHAMTPSLPLTIKSSTEKSDPNVEGELDLRSRNLSSTLHKLYLWEKKLYDEVKIEEKMRILHERKTLKLRRLDEKGAESHKVDAITTLIRDLSTKIRIAIQVVDKISVKINILRDEDLWPLLNESMQGLCKMWKGMLECHHNQSQAINEAKHLDSIAIRKHFSDAHLEATLELEHALLNWILRFSNWVTAQKCYARALNNWLIKCLLYVPEETADGIVPFSPGRIGAPQVFVVCNQWSQSLDRVSEKEVLHYMRDFVTNVVHLWDEDKLEMRQKMNANKEMERKIKNLEKEDLKIQKEIQALDKRMVLVSGDDNNSVVYQSDTTKSGSLQVGLKRIFEAMERFASNSVKVYDELLQRIEEDNNNNNNLVGDHENVE